MQTTDIPTCLVRDVFAGHDDSQGFKVMGYIQPIGKAQHKEGPLMAALTLVPKNLRCKRNMVLTAQSPAYTRKGGIPHTKCSNLHANFCQALQCTRDPGVPGFFAPKSLMWLRPPRLEIKPLPTSC